MTKLTQLLCLMNAKDKILNFAADYGLIIGSYGFYYRLWIENPSGCKLVMAAQRGIIYQICMLSIPAQGGLQKPQSMNFSSQVFDKNRGEAPFTLLIGPKAMFLRKTQFLG